jgi:outer membrane autotransporter protein
VQSVLGGTATAAFSVPFGVVQPQLSASWVHEYANDQRNVNGQFVEDNRPNPTTFKFQLESPDRNYAVISAGVSAVLPHDIQPFAEFSTMQGNSNFVSYGGSAGVRVAF